MLTKTMVNWFAVSYLTIYCELFLNGLTILYVIVHMKYSDLCFFLQMKIWITVVKNITYDHILNCF